MSVPVDIYCDGRRAAGTDARHDPWLVARWIRIDGEWARTRRVADAGAKPYLLKGELSQLLRGNELLTSPDEWATDARTKYPFKCPRCGFDVSVPKSAKLVAFLDAHEPDDVPPPLLSELVATVN